MSSCIVVFYQGNLISACAAAQFDQSSLSSWTDHWLFTGHRVRASTRLKDCEADQSLHLAHLSKGPVARVFSRFLPVLLESLAFTKVKYLTKLSRLFSGPKSSPSVHVQRPTFMERFRYFRDFYLGTWACQLSSTESLWP